MLYTVLASAMAGGEETRWDMRSEQRPQQQRSVPVTGSEDEQAEAVQSSYLEYYPIPLHGAGCRTCARTR